MNPVFKPIVLIFDLDETLFEAEEYESQKSYLSSSAEIDLSHDEQGLVYDWQINSYRSMRKIQAIARDQFKKIFEKVYQIRKIHGNASPIAVKILTAGRYEEAPIKKLFDLFYAANDSRFSNNLFPIEFFNRNNFLAEDRGSKAIFMTRKYGEWLNQMPKLEKENIYLIDNQEKQTSEVIKSGFSAFHFPTTVHTRPADVKYSIASPLIFEKLNRIIDGATLVHC